MIATVNVLSAVCMCVYLLCVSRSAHRRRPAFAAFVCALFSVEISRFQRVKTAHRAKAHTHTHMERRKMPLLRSGCTCSSFPLVSSSPSWINLQNTKRRPTNMYTHKYKSAQMQVHMYVCKCMRVSSHRRDLFFTLETILLAIFL